jgi:hypothetical protein
MTLCERSNSALQRRTPRPNELRYIHCVASHPLSRRTFCTQLCLALGAASSLARGAAPLESDPIPIPPDRVADTYAIFSLLIPLLQDGQPCSCCHTGHPKKKKGYLVPDTTADPSHDAFPQTPVAQTKPPMPPGQAFFAHMDPMDVPDDQMAQFREAVADYISRIGERVRLEPKFNLPLNYQLMDSKQLDEYTKTLPPHVANTSRPWPPDCKLVKKYKGWGPLSWMSEVYFDRARTLGLVSAAAGNGCMVNWYAFEKRDGQWRKAAWKDRGQCEQA